MIKTYSYIFHKLSLLILTVLYSQLTFAQTPILTYGAPDFDPRPGIAGITYSSSNLAVATIVAGKVHITGAGTTTISGKLGSISGSQAINIKPANLTIAVNNAVGVSGLKLPAFSVNYSGFVNGDTEAKLTGLATFSTTATSLSPAGNYHVTAGGATSPNYNITYVPGTLMIVPVSTVTAPLPVKTYGNADFYVFGSDIAGVTYTSSNLTVATILKGKVHIVGAGTTTITVVSGAGTLGKTLTVNKAPLTIKANDQTQVAGSLVPSFSASLIGLIRGDDYLQTTPPQISTTVTYSSPPGDYTITVSGASSKNYNITYQSGTCTVVSLSTITAFVPVKKYGDSEFYLFGRDLGGITYTSNNTNVAFFYAGKIYLVGAGNALITTYISGHGYVYKNITVNKAPLTITVNNVAKLYGFPNPLITLDYNGLVNEDKGLVTPPVITTTALVSSAPGSYPITVTGSSTNYDVTYVPGKLTVIDPTTSAPYIAYSGAKTYIAGKPITALSPTNSGGAVPATIYGQVTTFAVGDSFTANPFGVTPTFGYPIGLAIDKQGNVYVGDDSNYAIRKITPGGVMTLLAGNGKWQYVNGTGIEASFQGVMGIATDPLGNVYVPDGYSHVIRKITPAGLVTTFAGNGTKGATDGPLATASFDRPTSIVVDKVGNIYVVDTSLGAIRKISTAGIVTTITTGLNYPYGLTIDIPGNLFVSDDSHRIFKITPAGIKTVFAGSGNRESADGIGTAASFYGPGLLTADAFGNIFVPDSNLVRKITPAGVVTTLTGSIAGYKDGIGTAAQFAYIAALATDASGNLYATDEDNSLIRKITLTGYAISPQLPAGLIFDGTTGTITGTPTTASPSTNYIITGYNTAGSSSTTLNITIAPTLMAPNINYSPNTLTYTAGTAISPLVPTNTGGNVPAIEYGHLSTFATTDAWGIATDSKGNIYTTNQIGFQVKKITPNGVVSAFAGNGQSGNVNATGINASFGAIFGIAIDGNDNIFVADAGNHLIRKINQAGIVTNFAGEVPLGSNTPSVVGFPWGLAADSAGNVYQAELSSTVIKSYSPAGLLSSVGKNLSTPYGVAINNTGAVFVSDATNRIYKFPGSVFAGSGAKGAVNGTGTAASFNKPGLLAADNFGNVYVADEGNNLVRKVTSAGVVTTLANIFTPTSLALDKVGNLYAAGNTHAGGNIFQGGTVYKISLNGYSINPALPAGLNFDATTGIISGTPTSENPNTSYTITAYNAAGSSQQTLSIVVNKLKTTSFQALTEINSSTIGEPKVRPAMSPNGDGINDVLTIDNITQYPDNKLTLIDRNGMKIFEISGYDNLNKAFDGHSNVTRRMQYNGTYFYRLEYKNKGELKSKTGFFVLK